jgi:molecular chaperone DnaK (HSP70)
MQTSEKLDGRAIGVNLGSRGTYSRVGVWETESVANDHGNLATPFVVFFTDAEFTAFQTAQSARAKKIAGRAIAIGIDLGNTSPALEFG